MPPATASARNLDIRRPSINRTITSGGQSGSTSAARAEGSTDSQDALRKDLARQTAIQYNSRRVASSAGSASAPGPSRSRRGSGAARGTGRKPRASEIIEIDDESDDEEALPTLRQAIDREFRLPPAGPAARNRAREGDRERDADMAMEVNAVDSDPEENARHPVTAVSGGNNPFRAAPLVANRLRRGRGEFISDSEGEENGATRSNEGQQGGTRKARKKDDKGKEKEKDGNTGSAVAAAAGQPSLLSTPPSSGDAVREYAEGYASDESLPDPLHSILVRRPRTAEARGQPREPEVVVPVLRGAGATARTAGSSSADAGPSTGPRRSARATSRLLRSASQQSVTRIETSDADEEQDNSRANSPEFLAPLPSRTASSTSASASAPRGRPTGTQNRKGKGRALSRTPSISEAGPSASENGSVKSTARKPERGFAGTALLGRRESLPTSDDVEFLPAGPASTSKSGSVTEELKDRFAQNLRAFQHAKSAHLARQDEAPLIQYITKPLDLDDELECTICMEVMVSPVALRCLHHFCQACVEPWLEEHGRACPACRELCPTEPVRSHLIDAIIKKHLSSVYSSLESSGQSVEAQKARTARAALESEAQTRRIAAMRAINERRAAAQAQLERNNAQVRVPGRAPTVQAPRRPTGNLLMRQQAAARGVGVLIGRNVQQGPAAAAAPAGQGVIGLREIDEAARLAGMNREQIIAIMQQ